MATERTAMMPDGTVIFVDANKETMIPFGVVVSVQDIAVASGFQPIWAIEASKQIGFM